MVIGALTRLIKMKMKLRKTHLLGKQGLQTRKQKQPLIQLIV
ncbi:Protein LNK2 [Zea mays]|uniref:Protein LNK2 n=1 Tax=Zea mays TaxID=4577 RepID=A0A1D6FIT1_MAIZE|nr:Protein LNK2 [Zea mays]